MPINDIVNCWYKVYLQLISILSAAQLESLPTVGNKVDEGA